MSSKSLSDPGEGGFVSIPFLWAELCLYLMAFMFPHFSCCSFHFSRFLMFFYSFFFVILNLLTKREFQVCYLNPHLVQLLLKTVLKFPSKLKIDQSYDPAIPFVSKNTKTL
jgi:hypothetical protein